MKRLLLMVWLLAGTALAQSDFTILVVPDAQCETLNQDAAHMVYPTSASCGGPAGHMDMLNPLLLFIQNNHNTGWNVKAVLSTGDEVETGSMSVGWNFWGPWQSSIEALGIPVIATIGNHDGNVPLSRDYTNFENAAGANHVFNDGRGHKIPYTSFFGGNFNPSNPVWNGKDGTNANAWFRVPVGGGRNVILLTLEHCPRTAAVTWAQDVLNHTSDPVIFQTHQYLTSGGLLSSQATNPSYYCAGAAFSGGSKDGQDLWDGLVKTNGSRFLLTVSGHLTYTAHRTDTATDGTVSNAILTDWQGYTANGEGGGMGYVTLLKFRPSLHRIEVNTCSMYAGVGGSPTTPTCFSTNALPWNLSVPNDFPLSADQIGWRTLPNTDLWAVRETNIDYTSGNAEGALKGLYSYTGGVADTERNRMIIWGGGHLDYFSNEMYGLRLDTNPPKVQLLNHASLPSACVGGQTGNFCGNNTDIEAVPAQGTAPNMTACTGAGCRPSSRHSVSALAYVTHRHEMLSTGGILAGPLVPADGYGHSGAFWSLNLPTLYAGSDVSTAAGDAATSWTRLSSNWTVSGGSASQYPGTGWGTSVYDGRKYVWVERESLWRYDPDTNTLLYQGPSPESQHDGTMGGVYDPDRDWIWYIGGDPIDSGYNYIGVGYRDTKNSPQTMHWINGPVAYNRTVGGENHTGYESIPAGCDWHLGYSNSPGLAWDPYFHAIVIWQPQFVENRHQNPEKLYLFNPSPTKTLQIYAMGINTIAPQTCAAIDTSTWAETVGPQPSTDLVGGVFGRFAYYPQLDLYATCHGFVNCKTLKLDRQPADVVTVYDTH